MRGNVPARFGSGEKMRQILSESYLSTFKSIGENAFRNCIGLTSVTIPNSVTYIGEWAFKGCKQLISAILQR